MQEHNGGQIVIDGVELNNATPLVRIALLLGTGEEAAEVELSVEAGEGC